MATDHDVADPVEDAYARGITFTQEQADWIAHHVNNGLVCLAVICEQTWATDQHIDAVKAVRKRLTRVVHAATIGIRGD
jgi:hypothetical protein